jgi:hypothetical protein
MVLLAACAKQDAQQPAQPPAGYYQQPPPGYYQQQQAPPGYYQQQPPPGYPPQQQPGYPGAPAQVPTARPPTAPVPPVAQQPTAQPPATATLPLPPIGAVDATGSFTPQYMRQEPAGVVAELVAALPDASRAKVQGIPLQTIEDPKEVNAFAGCSQTGGPFMGITAPLLLIMARTSEARAFDELYGTTKYTELSNGIANEVKGQKTVAGPPSGFLPLPQALDPRKLARQSFLFDEQISFVLGHELAHHYRGHTGCANGAASSNGITSQDIGRLLSSTVPLFNQPNEIEADVQGTWSLLDTGSRRQAGRWTEEGALMVLDFFTRLQSLGVETVVLGFLQTHPPPQLRLPIVQNAAQQWRSNGGKAPVFPFQLPF